jgi:hypothetical protein
MDCIVNGAASMQRTVENEGRTHDTAEMEPSLEDMARTLVESGHYRVTSRLQTPAEYHPPDSSPAVASLLGSMTPANRPRRWRQHYCQHSHQRGEV